MPQGPGASRQQRVRAAQTVATAPVTKGAILDLSIITRKEEFT
jgi:hypothetical protein